MKKTALILFGMLIMVSTIEAKTGNEKPNRIRVNYTYDNAVNFIERGIEFYIFTNGDFDFNVVIRSILYDAEKKYLSFSVGSAVTAKSSPEKEYEECLLKAKAMQFVLTNSNEL
mgnify:CR=1 FL=1